MATFKVIIDDELAEQLDRLCAESGYSRSQQIEGLILAEVAEAERQTTKTASAKPVYVVRGNIRGKQYEGRSLRGALAAIKADRAYCKARRGYSDVALYKDGAHVEVFTADDGSLFVEDR